MHEVVGLLVALGLNLSLVSCASALAGTADNGCSHCTESQQFHHGEASHDMPCAAGVADCGTVDALSHDSRGTLLKLKDTSNDAPVAIIAAGESKSARHFVDPIGALPAQSTLPGAPTPLNVLFCVYLD